MSAPASTIAPGLQALLERHQVRNLDEVDLAFLQAAYERTGKPLLLPEGFVVGTEPAGAALPVVPEAGER